MPEEVEPGWLPDICDPRCPSIALVTDTDFEQRLQVAGNLGHPVVVAIVNEHCPKLHADLVMLEIVARSGRQIVRLHADAPHSRETRARFDIRDCPTLMLFVGGELRSTFRGTRTIAAVGEWIERDSGPLP